MTKENMLTINIDGKEVKTEPGRMLIEVADEAGVYIPRFCYHKKLSITASCRMCLVDIERMPKPSPACATPVSDGMIVRTRSEKTKAAQRAVMEFLLINHPLDCPVCDQGGECELQDFSVEYGAKSSLYKEEKRHYEKIDIGPLVETFMNRCIQCTRCVRFGDEIAGMQELGGIDRGDRLEITTYIKHALESEVSANIIDVCPVGALTAKPSKFQARPWEYESHSSVSIHDGVGSNIRIHTYRDEIARVVPEQNEAINEVWIADRDRFSYEAIHSDDRALEPLLDNGEGHLLKSSWQDALKASKLLIEGAIEKHGADEVGILVSPSATIEEMHLVGKLAKALNIENVDYRFKQNDFSEGAPALRTLGVAIDEIDQLDSALLVGADLRSEAPILGIQLRRAVTNGAKVSTINTVSLDPLHEINASSYLGTYDWVGELASILSLVAKEKNADINASLKSYRSVESENAKSIAIQLLNHQNQWIVLGEEAITHPEFSIIEALAMEIASITGASLGYITPGANASAAALTTGIADSEGLNAKSMFEKPLTAYVLVGAIDYMEDLTSDKNVYEALQAAEVVIAITPFASADLRLVATSILPAAAWGETSGSLMNLEGKVQSVRAASLPKGEARPAWKILRVLGNEFEIDGFDYICSSDVLKEWQAEVGEIKLDNLIQRGSILANDARRSVEGVIAVPQRSTYSTDAYVRRSEALQKTPLAKKKCIKVALNSPLLASKEISIGNDHLSVMADERLPSDVVIIPAEYSTGIAFYQNYEETK